MARLIDEIERRKKQRAQADMPWGQGVDPETIQITDRDGEDTWIPLHLPLRGGSAEVLLDRPEKLKMDSMMKSRTKLQLSIDDDELDIDEIDIDGVRYVKRPENQEFKETEKALATVLDTYWPNHMGYMPGDPVDRAMCILLMLGSERTLLDRRGDDLGLSAVKHADEEQKTGAERPWDQVVTCDPNARRR